MENTKFIYEINNILKVLEKNEKLIYKKYKIFNLKEKLKQYFNLNKKKINNNNTNRFMNKSKKRNIKNKVQSINLMKNSYLRNKKIKIISNKNFNMTKLENYKLNNII